MPFMVGQHKMCPRSASSGNYHPQRDPVFVSVTAPPHSQGMGDEEY